MSDLRERVRLAIADAAHTPITVGQSADYADAAITAVIEALAEEADGMGERHQLALRLDDGNWYDLPYWLRAHLDDGRDGEVTDAQ